MIGMHLAQHAVKVPETLPDLFEVLWSVAGCGMFLLAWLVTCVKLFSPICICDDEKQQEALQSTPNAKNKL